MSYYAPNPWSDNRPPECCWCGHEITDEADEIWKGREVYCPRCAVPEKDDDEAPVFQEAAE